MWCIELCREDVASYNNVPSARWEVVASSTHFIKQQKQLTLPQRSRSVEPEIQSCCFCRDFPALAKCLLCAETDFRIIYNGDDPALVIAKASELREIQDFWDIIQQEIQPMLLIYEQENLKKVKKKPRSTETNHPHLKSLKTFLKAKIHHVAPSNDTENQNQVANKVRDFVLMKIAAFIKTRKQYKSGIGILNESYFRRVFPTFPTIENAQLLEKCSFWLLQYYCGALCISDNFLFFIEATNRSNFWLPLTSIEEIQMNSQRSFQSISFTSKGNPKFFILELPEFEETFETIKITWRQAVQRSVQGDKTRELTIPKLRKRKIKRSNSCDRNSFVEMISSSGSSVYTDSLYPDGFDSFEPLFTNPALECLVQVRCSLFRNRGKNVKTREGVLDVSYRSIHFSSLDNVYVVTIPYVDIHKISYGESKVLQIYLKEKQAKNIFISLSQVDVAQMITQLYKTFDGEASTSQYIRETITDSLWEAKQSFFAPFLSTATEKVLLKDWKQYFAYFGSGSTIIRTRQLSKLLLQGIPNSLRPMLWQVMSGSYYSRLNEAIPYSYYLQKARTCKENGLGNQEQCDYIEEISKDINRALPEHPFFSSDGPGVESLNNILISFSWRNPEIGYCQGMNIIGAVLLLFMPEEDAYFLLCTIVEDIFPEYFTKSMTGSLVDLEILDDLLAQHLPKVHRHISRNIGGISVIAVPWLMCMFIHCLPWESTFRAIDLILSKGSNAVFVVSLAILGTCKEAILSVKREKLLDLVKNELGAFILPSKLIKQISYFDSLLSSNTISLLRAKYKPKFLNLGDEENLDSENNDTDTGTDTDTDIEESKELTDTDPQYKQLMEDNLKKFDEMVKEKVPGTLTRFPKPLPLVASELLSSGPSLTPRGRYRSNLNVNEGTPIRDIRKGLSTSLDGDDDDSLAPRSQPRMKSLSATTGAETSHSPKKRLLFSNYKLSRGNTSVTSLQTFLRNNGTASLPPSSLKTRMLSASHC